MKILSQIQQRGADEATINREPISSLELMERAANRWLQAAWPYLPQGPVAVLAGFGNNGGDALVIARLLHLHGVETRVFMACFGRTLSSDCQANLNRLPQDIPIIWLSVPIDISAHAGFLGSACLIDGMFGSGLHSYLDGSFAQLVAILRELKPYTLAIDIPSGMLGHRPSFPNAPILPAREVLTFQSPKLAFFYPEHEGLIGDFHVVDIGLDKNYIDSLPCTEFTLEKEAMAGLVPLRSKFSHKGHYGKVGVILGQWRTHGAAILSAMSALSIGAGKVYVISKESFGINIKWPGLMLALPEDELGQVVYCLGPGLGTHTQAADNVKTLIKKAHLPMVVDADAINVLAANRNMIDNLPAGSVLTPHLGELERLLGPWDNTPSLHQKARDFAHAHGLVLVLKGAHTAVVESNGNMHFNTTGNPGLAKAGSGDVLSGVIAGLMAQGLDPVEAAKLGVYLHGLAADCLQGRAPLQSMTPMGLSESLGQAIQVLTGA